MYVSILHFERILMELSGRQACIRLKQLITLPSNVPVKTYDDGLVSVEATAEYVGWVVIRSQSSSPYTIAPSDSIIVSG